MRDSILIQLFVGGNVGAMLGQCWGNVGAMTKVKWQCRLVCGKRGDNEWFAFL